MIFLTPNGDETKPLDLYINAIQCLEELEDTVDRTGNPQMHRKAVAGKKLVVKVHNFDSSAYDGIGGCRVSLRVEGQYLDRACVTLKNVLQAGEFGNALSEIIEKQPIPITH